MSLLICLNMSYCSITDPVLTASPGPCSRNLLFEGKKLWAFFPPSELGRAAPPKVEATDVWRSRDGKALSCVMWVQRPKLLSFEPGNLCSEILFFGIIIFCLLKIPSVSHRPRGGSPSEISVLLDSALEGRNSWKSWQCGD